MENGPKARTHTHKPFKMKNKTFDLLRAFISGPNANISGFVRCVYILITNNIRWKPFIFRFGFVIGPKGLPVDLLETIVESGATRPHIYVYDECLARAFVAVEPLLRLPATYFGVRLSHFNIFHSDCGDYCCRFATEPKPRFGLSKTISNMGRARFLHTI